MNKQVEELLAKYIEESRLANVKPLEEEHAAQEVGSEKWWTTFHQLQVEQAKIAGMEKALSFVEGAHFAQSA